MNKSDTITKLSAALVKAQSHIGAATKGTSNPFFKSKFASLGEVMEAVKDPLLDQGISILQPVGRTDDGRTYVETLLIHESGEWISDQMLVSPTKANDPQAQGSAISYARRYSLQSMLFVPAVDDDGESAMSRRQPQQEPIKPSASPEETDSEKPIGYWKSTVIPSGSNKGKTLNQVDDEALLGLYSHYEKGKGFTNEFAIAVRDACIDKQIVDISF